MTPRTLHPIDTPHPPAAGGAAARRWVLVFAVTMLAALWGGVAYEIVKDRDDAFREWSENLSNLTHAYAEHTLRAITAIDQDAKFVRNLYVKRGRDLDLTELVSAGGLDGVYRRIGVIDANGRYAATSGAPRPTTARDIEDFDSQLFRTGDEAVIGVPHLSHTTGDWSIHLTRRINRADGSFGGVVAASLDPSYFSDLYARADLGPGGLVHLVGDDGALRAEQQGQETLPVMRMFNTPLFNQYLHARSGAYVSKSVRDGITRLYTFQRLPGYPLTLITGVTENKIYERSDEHRNAYLVMGLIATLMIFLFTSVILRLLRDQAHNLEELRVSREQAESANRLKSEFLASMSHELRTPLNGILGFSEIIQRKSVDEKSRRHGEMIRTAGKHLLSILNAILDIAKIEAGKVEVYARDIELRPLIESVAQIHEVTALAKGLAFNVAISPDVPAEMHTDPTLLQQILNNLVNNAIKFTERGHVSLRVERELTNGRVKFSVRDTGIGIPQASLALVFEKFRQADQSATRSHQGTGLGLTLAKQLTELLGGEIGLFSVEGEGTTIYFHLPVSHPAAAAAATPAAQAAPAPAALAA